MIASNPNLKNTKKPKIIVIVGPTAIGKTSLSISVAKAIESEIISADSRQVYTGLDIGTGKVTQKEMDGVPHHLLNVADPRTVFTASNFVEQGTVTLQNILKKDKVPVIVGGTGFYIDALLGHVVLPDVPPNEVLRSMLRSKTNQELQQILKEKDLERYETIDRDNPRRLIRALEIAEALGKNPPPNTESPYEVLWIGLHSKKEDLEKNIHTRLLERLDEGMIEEVENLHKNGLGYERMEELGLEYRYIARHLQNKLTREEMVVELEREINRYAKRQMTWFKRNKDIFWFNPDQTGDVITSVITFLK